MSLTSNTIIKPTELHFTPEEAAFVMRLRVFITMRWFAIAGIIIATLVASKIFRIGFPTLPVYFICIFVVMYNLVAMYGTRSLEPVESGNLVQRVRRQSDIQIFADLATLTVLLHFTGGIENPFIFFFVFHIMAASIVLPYRTVYLLSTSAILMVTLLVVLEYTGIIPHVNLAGFVLPTRYRDMGRIVAVLVALGTILYTTTYMSTAVSGELRKRQREVLQLREELIKKKTGELEEASRAIIRLEQEKERFLRFISIAAHDLKAPLTAIQGFIWVMLSGISGELTAKQKNMLERSSRRINELLTLISNLLDIPRIETGQIVEEMKEISPREIIERSVDDLRGLAEEKGLKIEVQFPENLPKIRGSASRLQQVMTNLIANAINYTQEGSITVKVSERDNNLQVEVVDTGIGIPSQDLPRIFEDFFRGSNVEVKGTGLGLSITKRIIEAHGGKIWVESPCLETNRGTKFTFILPKDKEK